VSRTQNRHDWVRRSESYKGSMISSFVSDETPQASRQARHSASVLSLVASWRVPPLVTLSMTKSMNGGSCWALLFLLSLLFLIAFSVSFHRLQISSPLACESPTCSSVSLDIRSMGTTVNALFIISGGASKGTERVIWPYFSLLSSFSRRL